MPTFKAIVIDKGESGQSVRLADFDDKDLMDGDVTVRPEWSTVNYKDGLAVTGKAPVVRRFPMIAGIDFAGTNTAREEFELPPMHEGNVSTVDFHLELPELYPGSFSFSPAIADGTLHSYRTCDWIDNAIVLQMMAGPSQIYGHVHLPCRVEFNRALAASHAERGVV